MKYFLAIAFVLSSLTLWANEDEGHTAEYCAVGATEVCAHLGHMEGFTSQVESHFVAHITKSLNTEVKDLKVELIMHMENGHSHGSAPVQVTEFGPNHFKVDQAYFVMAGRWVVELKFNIAGNDYLIEIPVDIKE